MSRICVKALPKHITQERMLEVFSQVGDVTDVRLLKTKTGQRRNMGFVGFRNEDDAAKAINRLNNTFIDTSKIHVEVAKAIGSTELERPWSKHSKGSSRYELAHPELKKQRDLERLKEKEREKAEADSKKLDKNDPKLLEFLGIHKKAKKWENDDNMAEASDDDNKSKKRKIKGEVDGKNKKAKKETKQEEKIEKKNKPSSKSIEETPQAKVNVVTKDDIKKDKVLQAEFGDSDDDYEDLPNSKQALYLGDEDEMKEAEIDDVPMDDDAEDDMDYIKSKMQKGKKSTDSDESSDSEGDSASESEKEEGEEKNTGRTNEADTGRLFVRNLPFTITEDELRDLFGKYGLLSDVHIPQDKESNRSKGIAMVLYMVPSDATKAKEALDKAIFQGRVLHVMPGEEQRNIESLKKETPEGAGGGKRDSSFKEKKLKDQKAQSTNAHNWNSLYIRSDAVVDAFCARNNVNRSDIYDPSQPNLAVQLALMETQTIMETKNYFERQGVNIEVLSSSVDKAVKRSNTVILIKNIPFETTSNELTQQFEKHGPLARVIVPPSRTVAILEFVNQPDAKSAFKSMAYRKYHGVPLYLEWAPIKVFDTPTPAPLPKSKSAAPVDNEEEESIVPAPAKPAKNPFKPDISAAPTSKPSAPTPSTNITTTTKATTTTTPAKPIANPLKTAPAKPAPAEPESAGEPVSSLYVTNISFKTKDENLVKLFNKQPGYTNMNIPKKIDKKTKLPTMSSGNAFVTFDTPEQAASALKALQGASLDGFKLKLAFTNPKKKEGGIPATIPRPPVANKADDEEKETVLPGQADDKGPTKVMIRNIPFEANESEVSALFKSVGGFKQLRMPQKMDHKHRGFGFVEFLTHNEAKKALETMANTHLYGRHLVLEFANADRNLDEIRKKTRKDYEKLARAEGKPLDWFDV